MENTKKENYFEIPKPSDDEVVVDCTEEGWDKKDDEEDNSNGKNSETE